MTTITMIVVMTMMMNDDNEDNDGGDGDEGYLYVRGWVPLFRVARGLPRDGIRD